MFFNCETDLSDWTIIRYNRPQIPRFDQIDLRLYVFVSCFLFDASLFTPSGVGRRMVVGILKGYISYCLGFCILIQIHSVWLLTGQMSRYMPH